MEYVYHPIALQLRQLINQCFALACVKNLLGKHYLQCCQLRCKPKSNIKQEHQNPEKYLQKQSNTRAWVISSQTLYSLNSSFLQIVDLLFLVFDTFEVTVSGPCSPLVHFMWHFQARLPLIHCDA